MTIEVPTPSIELLQQVETATIQANENEAAAVAAIREKFAAYAKHNGTIKTADYSQFSAGQRIDIQREAYYVRDGRRVHGLRLANSFCDEGDGANAGSKTGFRLYLTERGEWLELERVGRWSCWEGAANYWYTDSASADEVGMGEDEDATECGHIRIMTDAEVANEYNFVTILNGISESMAELTKKLPERFSKLTARAELARRTLEALK